MELIDISLFSLPDTHGQNEFLMLGTRCSDLDARSAFSECSMAILRRFNTPESMIAALAPLHFPEQRLERYVHALRSGGSASLELLDEQAKLIEMTVPTKALSQPVLLEPERVAGQGIETSERRADVIHPSKQRFAA